MKTGPRVRSDTQTRAYPLRMTLTEIDDTINLAKKCNYSGNLFMMKAIAAVVEIVKAPAGKPIELPEFIATSRYTYHYNSMKDKPTLKG
jgi:hypothetical protein